MKLAYHLGYPRTASKLLQHRLFPNHTLINYLGPKGFVGNYKYYFTQPKIDELAELFTQHELKNKKINDNFNKNLSDLEKIIDINKFSNEKINIISSEAYLNIKRIYRNEPLLILFEFIKKHFPETKLKIFYTVRNQFDLIFSNFHHLYREYSKFLYSNSLDDLITKIAEKQFTTTEIEQSNLYTFLKVHDFNYTYDFIRSTFPEAEIKILKYEDLENNSENYFRNLCDFLEISDGYEECIQLVGNEKINELSKKGKNIYVKGELLTKLLNNKIYRKIHGLLPSPLINFFKSNGIFFSKKKYNQKSHDEMKSIIKNHYSSSNKKFLKKTGVEIIY